MRSGDVKSDLYASSTLPSGAVGSQAASSQGPDQHLPLSGQGHERGDWKRS